MIAPHSNASTTRSTVSAPLPDGMDEVMAQKLCYSLDFDREAVRAGPVTLAISFSCNEIDSYVVAALSRLDHKGQRHVLSMGGVRPARR